MILESPMATGPSEIREAVIQREYNQDTVRRKLELCPAGIVSLMIYRMARAPSTIIPSG